MSGGERDRRGEQQPGSRRTATPDVIVCAGGPVLLRGEHVVCDEDGTAHRTRRPVSAVCRCGKSADKPWCDGTHKAVPDKYRP